MTIRDELPAGLSYTSSDNADCDAIGGVFECVIDDTLAVGDALVVELTVDVLAAAYPSVTNAATVSTESEDIDPGNDASTVTSPVTPDIRFELVKRLASSQDDRATWEITVSSVGLNDAFDGVEITDALPDELSYVSSASDDGFACAPDPGGALVCLHADALASGESASFSIETATTQEYGTGVTNVAVVTGGHIVEPEEPVTASAVYVRNLPFTGGELPVWAMLAALLALLGGGAMMTYRRRETEKA